MLLNYFMIHGQHELLTMTTMNKPSNPPSLSDALQAVDPQLLVVLENLVQSKMAETKQAYHQEIQARNEAWQRCEQEVQACNEAWQRHEQEVQA